jgi:hypothetical protein
VKTRFESGWRILRQAVQAASRRLNSSLPAAPLSATDFAGPRLRHLAASRFKERSSLSNFSVSAFQIFSVYLNRL